MSSHKQNKTLGLLTIAFFIADRVSKIAALSLSPIKPVLVASSKSLLNRFWMPDLYFSLVFNKGISWGILNNGGPGMFEIVTLVICGVTLWLLSSIIYKYKKGFSILPESLVFLGSLSNIYDRFCYGGVIDFILVNFGSWAFPVFNLADCAIVFGIFLMFLQGIVDNRLTPHENV